MRTWLKRGGWVLAVALIVAQFIPLKKTNPPVEPSKTIYASLAVPPGVQNVLDRSCKDCHSNETAWPWYSRVAPVSWMVVHDVNEGRDDLNLSEWGAYSAKKKVAKFKEICDQLSSGEMPDFKYALMHREARLTDDERAAVCQWTDATRKALAAAEPVPAPPASPASAPSSSPPK